MFFLVLLYGITLKPIGHSLPHLPVWHCQTKGSNKQVLHHWFKNYSGFTGTGKKAGLQRHKYMAWQTSIVWLVVELAARGSSINGATPSSYIVSTKSEEQTCSIVVKHDIGAMFGLRPLSLLLLLHKCEVYTNTKDNPVGVITDAIKYQIGIFVWKIG